MSQMNHKKFDLYPKEVEQEGKQWLITYSDLITLMLTFFILLFSMATLERDKFRTIVNSIRSGFGGMAAEFEPSESSETAETAPLSMQTEQETMLKEIQEFIQKRGLHENIMVSLEKNRIVIRMRDNVFFATGMADLNPEAYPVLDDIAVIFKTYDDFRVDIAGHTDDRPINNFRFPSNWELSAHRATIVLRHFIDHGIDAARLTATGYAEVMPLEPNYSNEARARNRRVEFIMNKEMNM